MQLGVAVCIPVIILVHSCAKTSNDIIFPFSSTCPHVPVHVSTLVGVLCMQVLSNTPVASEQYSICASCGCQCLCVCSKVLISSKGLLLSLPIVFCKSLKWISNLSNYIRLNCIWNNPSCGMNGLQLCQWFLPCFIKGGSGMCWQIPQMR